MKINKKITSIKEKRILLESLIGDNGDLVIPNDITVIPDCVLKDCKSLRRVVIHDGVTSIGSSAFRGCSYLTTVELTENSQLANIGDRAFYGCQALENLDMPNKFFKIGSKAFYGCNSLLLTTIDDCTYFGNKTNPYLYLIRIEREVTEVVIKDGCKFIDCYAFDSCYSLTKIVIPNGVTRIGNGAFCDCCSLTSIEIPNTVTIIGAYAFCDCCSLTSIKIPNSVKEIREGAFWGCCSLESVAFKENSQLTSIGERAFHDCCWLTSIEVPDSATIDPSAFEDCDSLKYNKK